MDTLPASHGSLRMLVDDAVVMLQPATSTAEKIETLSFDLNKGITLLTQKAVIRSSSCTEVLGVVGLYQLQNSAALVVITGAEQVAQVSGIPVFRVTETKVLTGSTLSHDDARILSLLKDAVDPQGSGRNVFFAYGADLTLTSQQAAAAIGDPVLSKKAIWERADNRFFWNRQLAKPLMEQQAHRFILTMFMGFVGEIRDVPLDGLKRRATATITLIARRSMHRAGTRHWRRGADSEGNAANFVESEQITSLDNGAVVASFVQVRASIPLLWTQLPNIKYKPPTKIAGKDRSSPAFSKHIENLVQAYKAVVAINLVNQHGSEGKLAEAFRQEAEAFIESHPKGSLQYIAFDFHKECGAKNYHRIANLWDKIHPFFREHAHFLVENGAVKSEQVGVCRTNCIDCLDRTNVVQAVLGRKALESALVNAGMLSATATLPSAFPLLEKHFKVLYADHGDAISTQYAGTGALKAGFTRTGKRTMGGFVDDGVKSVVRYYLNNFQDGKKQDAMDLITGTYQVTRGARPPLGGSASPLLPLLVATVAFIFAMTQLGQVGQVAHTLRTTGGASKSVGSHLLQSVLMPLVLAVSIVVLVVKNGKRLVCRPQLCPQLANTVEVVADKTA